MSIPLSVLMALIWMHFFADFILQTDKMAINKSSNSWWLTIHVFVYSLPFLFFGVNFAILTFCAHWLTDFASSRLTTKLWLKGERHWFFVVIGIDQALHMSALIGAWILLNN